MKGDKFIKFKEIDVLNFEKLAIILKYVYLSYHKTYELVPHVNNTSSFDIKYFSFQYKQKNVYETFVKNVTVNI